MIQIESHSAVDSRLNDAFLTQKEVKSDRTPWLGISNRLKERGQSRGVEPDLLLQQRRQERNNSMNIDMSDRNDTDTR